jgi:ATP-dependent RNA helicase DDX52/ROK1
LNADRLVAEIAQLRGHSLVKIFLVLTVLRDSAVTTVDQSLLYTGSESGKLLAVRSLISEGNLPYPSLIFVQSITRADELHRSLALDGLRVDVVHGSRTKAKRDEAIAAFRE